MLEAQPNAPLSNTARFTVPTGKLFLMGDNRDNAADSRLKPPNRADRFVGVEEIIGKVIWLYQSDNPSRMGRHPDAVK